ncbi:hypothetical protein C8A01DRAFT_18963 [Parachaetomium inaequale]|uniref:Uncharacterized protein n=1 Tax=Parachaetomium inaequale TaxID=2588326 RepID=A0AAN6P9F8_9PEZI|nr:hypothetical protein C8A01DRAFT_18963 [Parachaetomium inaequale]
MPSQSEVEVAQLLIEKTAEAKEFRKRWKLVAAEVNKLRVQNQAFYIVTDEYLRGQTARLRYEIWNFAFGYFDGLPSQQMSLKNPNAGSFQHFISTVEDFDLYSNNFPALVEAFLWRFLVNNVFDLFLWADTAAKPLVQLSTLLRPSESSLCIPTGYPDLQRRFQIWKASTTTFVLDSSRPANESMKLPLVQALCNALGPFCRTERLILTKEVTDIIGMAIDLDREICKQVALVSWVFPVPGDLSDGRLIFDGKRMMIEREQSQPTHATNVRLVVAPALVKRGNSNGEDFDLENVVVKMKVMPH